MEPYYQPGSVAQPEVPRPAPAPPPPGTDIIAWASDGATPAPILDLLHGRELPGMSAVVETAPPPPKRRKRLAVVLGVVAVGLLAGGGYLALMKKPTQVATVPSTPSPSETPSLTPTPTPSPTDTPTPSPTPSPTPTPMPTPETVTAPAQTPTPSNPQTVTVTDFHGLWLRSSPTSVNRSNIIRWMPQGAHISVDAEGVFWWHGTYNGRPGYFASKFTQ